MDLLDSSRLYFILSQVDFTLLDSTSFCSSYNSLYLNLRHSITALLYAPELYLIPLDSTSFYHRSTSSIWLYLFYHGCTGLYLTLLHSTLPLLDTKLHFTMALLHSIWIYFSLSWLHSILLHSTMALLHSSWFYFVLPRLYFIVFACSWFYHGCTSLYQCCASLCFILPWLFLTLLHPTMALLNCTWFYFILR